MTASLSCTVITDFAELEALAPEWQRLYETSSPPGGVFQSWGWARAYWTTHGHHLTLVTPVVFADGRVVGILPLAMHGRTLRLLGTPYTDYNGLLSEPERAGVVAAAAADALIDARLPWAECVLDGIPEASPLVRDAPLLPAHLRARQQVVLGSGCPVAVDDGRGLFDRLSPKESLHRHEKRLARHGTLEFRHIEGRSEILARLDEFIRLQVTRQAAMGTRSALADPLARRMLEALVEQLDPANDLRFAVLEVGGRAVAYHLGFEHAGRFIYYMPAFDMEFRNDSPGEVMLRRLLRYAHERQLREFDFTIGDEPYKKRFATHERRTFSVYVYRYPHRPQAEMHRFARYVRDVARNRPAAVAYARPALRVMRRFQERLHR